MNLEISHDCYEGVTDIIISDDNAWLVRKSGLTAIGFNHDDYNSDIEALKASISTHKDKTEWSLKVNNIPFRCACINSISGQVYVFRRGRESIPKLTDIYSSGITRILASKGLSEGLVIFSGPMSSGKTTSAAAMVSDRLCRYSGHAVTLEDPPELPLDGPHGDGYCFQTEAHDGDFGNGMKKMMRYNPSIIFIGEIRDEFCAKEALKASVNGHLVVATIHSSGIVETLSRLESLSGDPKLMADGISLIVHQTLLNNKAVPNLLLSHNIISVKEIIRSGNYNKLATEIQAQKNRLLLGKLVI